MDHRSPGHIVEGSRSVFFIIGRGRSGTALLTRILNEHPRISVAPEAIFIRNLKGRYQKREPFSEKEARAFFRDAFFERKMDYWKMEGEEFQEAFVHEVEGGDLRRACLALYWLYGTQVQEKEELQWIGEKNPHYSLYIKELTRLFPHAKFLHLVRDPRDNVRSFRHVGFDIQNVAGLATRWKLFEDRIARDAAMLSPAHYQKVRYEDLLEDPEGTLTRLCSFFGQAYDPKMLEFYKRQEKEYRDWHRNLNSPLDPGKMGKWRKELNAKELSTIEAICSEKMEEHGYRMEARAKGLTFKDRLGKAFGKLVTFFEEKIFLLPFSWRMRIINLYRKRAGAK